MARPRAPRHVAASYNYTDNGTISKAEFYNPEIMLGSSHNRYHWNFSYDGLNLPVRILMADGRWIRIGYDAAGQRILKETSEGSWTFYGKDGDQTLGMVRDDDLKYVALTGNGQFGRILGVDSIIDTTSARRYYLKDHLGSTRAVVDGSGTVVETFDYYSFGLLMPQRTSGSNTTIEQFTGKEYDTEVGLNLDYFGARYYDPALGRWSSVDPLADKFPYESPYAYVENNPTSFLDPNGAYRLFAATVGERNVVRLTRWSVNTVKKVEVANSILSVAPGGGFVKGVIQGIGDDPAWKASNTNIAMMFAGLAGYGASKLSTIGSYANIGLTSYSVYEGVKPALSEFTPSNVGFDKSLFNVLGSIKSGSENVFVRTDETSMELNSAIANSHSIQGAKVLTNDFIDISSGLLKGIAHSNGLNFSKAADRKAIMAEYQKNKDLYDYAIQAFVRAREWQREQEK